MAGGAVPLSYTQSELLICKPPDILGHSVILIAYPVRHILVT
jgi:hypothetical protein